MQQKNSHQGSPLINYQIDQLSSYITEPRQTDKNQQTTEQTQHECGTQSIFMIEKAIPPSNFNTACAELPKKVEFRKLINNILNSIKFLKQQKDKASFKPKEQEEEEETKFDRWLKYLQLDENKAVVSDSFWYAICKFFNPGKYPVNHHSLTEYFQDIEEKLLSRISKNYVSLFLSINDKMDNNLFFKTYFDVLSQGVFYAFFYAFPLSRSKFNDDLKKKLLDEFSYLFTGVEIANTDMYLDHWNLDLGAGNIFKIEAILKSNKKEELQQSLPPIRLTATTIKARNKRNLIPIKFSPIVEIYLKNHKYRTRNYIQGFKMKFTEIDKNQDELEFKFERYKNLADEVLQQSEAMRKDNRKKKRQMKKAITIIKEETVNHHKRLEKRKAEELERGAHEYANYLVSMLNAGITVANLGVSKQK